MKWCNLGSSRETTREDNWNGDEHLEKYIDDMSGQELEREPRAGNPQGGHGQAIRAQPLHKETDSRVRQGNKLTGDKIEEDRHQQGKQVVPQ